MKKVYIIVLNYNGWGDTIECLESVFRSDYPDFRVIVPDNNSRNNSMEHIKAWAEGRLDAAVSGNNPLRSLSFPPLPKPIPYVEFDRKMGEAGGDIQGDHARLVLIRTGENLGFAGGNNVGLRYALARKDFDYILLLNNDTVSDPAFLTELVKAAEERREAGILSPKIYFYDDPDLLWYAGGSISLFRGFSRHFGYREKDGIQYSQADEVDFITGCAFFIKRDVVDAIGLLDENMFCYGEDSDWSLRALRAGYSGLYVPTAKVWHKIGASTDTDFSIHMGTRNALYLVYKHASQGQFVIFFLTFMASWMLRRFIKAVFFGDAKALKASYKGLRDFWSMPKTKATHAGSKPVML